MKNITVTFAGFELKPKGDLEIIYIPRQRQILNAGQRYRITLKGLGDLINVLDVKKDNKEAQVVPDMTDTTN